MDKERMSKELARVEARINRAIKDEEPQVVALALTSLLGYYFEATQDFPVAIAVLASIVAAFSDDLDLQDIVDMIRDGIEDAEDDDLFGGMPTGH